MMSPMHSGMGHMDMMGHGGGGMMMMPNAGAVGPPHHLHHHHQQQQQQVHPMQQQQQNPQGQQQHQIQPLPVVAPPPPQGQPQSNLPQVSLSLLIDFIVQRTYHDLTVLAELLPRKTDLERKVEIFNFSSRTRMIMIRLLALVKWASSAAKVDKCASIMSFCERSAAIFMETADAMAKMSRETLVRATLPNFHLPAAVEILTSGSYSRVPRCIRDRIVPPEPITAAERRQILLRLNQVIEHRLVTSQLPEQMRSLTIENGRVTFVVRNEFEASLTLMGDGPHVPWRLLKVNILVEDKETGEGKALIHSMQVRYVERLIQSRLVDLVATNGQVGSSATASGSNTVMQQQQQQQQPLHYLYHTLHSLCQSLQLEVLHSQTQRLCRERLGDYVRIEEALPGRCLTVSYWRELTARDPSAELGFRFSVQVDPHDAAKPLMVVHVPPLPASSMNRESQLAEEQAICGDHISLERLLVHSIYARTKHRLSELKQEVQLRMRLGDVEATLHGSPAVLSIPILQPCLRSEQLLVTVDTHTGIFLAHVPQYEENPIAPEIQQALNSSGSGNDRLEALVSQLRYWITKQRVHKTLQQLPATSYERLPMLYNTGTHPLKDLSPNRMYIRLHRQPNAVLIVEFHERSSNHCEIDYRYFFLWVRPASIDDNPNEDSSAVPAPPSATDTPRVYLKALSMVELDPFLVTHSASTKVDVQELSEKIIGKRKCGGKVEAPIKRTKFPAYFISDLAHVVSFTDERLPFTSLVAELTRRGVAHSGVETEEKAVGLVVKIFGFPAVTGAASNSALGKGVAQRLQQKYLLSVDVRLQNRSGRVWKVEFVFNGNPVAKIQNGGGSRKALHLSFDYFGGGDAESAGNVVDSILQEWEQMVHLFELVDDMEEYTSRCSDDMATANASHFVSIKSYSFREATLEYGPGHRQIVQVKWSSARSRFTLVFGGVGENSGMCPHNLVREQLETHLNEHRSLPLLARILHETFLPIRSICRLPSVPQMSVSQQRVNHPVETFVALPQSPTHIKVVFYNTYCLDVQIKSGGLVFIRDGAISLFDQRKAMEETQPIQGLKGFLMKYVDEAALQGRRQSQTEDDNPPSPMSVIDDPSSASSSHGAAGTSGLKFNTPHTPPSNPLTPASPHVGSSSSNLSAVIQSPPSMMQPSPQQHPIPSPSGFTVPSPLNHASSSVGSPFPSARSPMAMDSPRPSPRMMPHGGGQHLGGGGGGSNLGGKPQTSSATRLLPQRLWAGAHPTPLTPQAFDELCRPSPMPSPGPGYITPNVFLAPVHRFLGSLFLRRQLQHMIRQEDWIQSVPSGEPTTIAFKVEGMTCRFSCFASNSYQSLHAKLEPDPQSLGQWTPEMLQVLEKFFDTRVAVPPFRPHALTAYIRILQCPIEPIKDIVNIMRFEIIPDLVAKNNLKWNCRICMTVPPAAPPIMPLGQPGLLRLKEKMLLFLHITRANVQLPPGQEPLSVVIPLVYDINMNQTTVAQKEMNSVINMAGQHLNRLQRSGQLNLQRCTIFPSVQDLLCNLTLPNEGPAHQMLPQQQQAMVQQFQPQQQMMQQQQIMMGAGPMQGSMGRAQMPQQQRMMNPNMVMQQRAQMMPQQHQNQFMS